MDMNEYQKLAARTIDKSLPPISVQDHALHGMVSELGELHGIFQKIYQGHVPEKEHMMKEVGDLLWFIAEFCTSRRWKLSDVAQMNIDKLIARYPDGFDADHSLHRKDGDI